MFRRISLSAMLVGALLASACAKTANVEQERSALMAMDKEWSGTLKDLDKFMSYLSPEATQYGPGMPKASGATAIRAAMKEMMSMPGLSLQWAAQRAEVSSSGDLGYTVGTYEMKMNNPAGKPMTDKGKYITVWKKQADGKWKAVEDIFNSDAPPPMTMSAPTVVANADVKWGDAPPVLAKGAKMAVIAGDPSKPAPFVLRLQMPNGYRIAPHWHPTDEHVTVLSGTFAAAMGEKWDDKAMKDFAAGSFANMAATMPHYAQAKGATTVQVDGIGPFVLNYVNAADDPSKGKN